MIKEIYCRAESGMEFSEALMRIKSCKPVGWFMYGIFIFHIYSDENSRTLYITTTNFNSDCVCYITVCEFMLMHWINLISKESYKRTCRELKVSEEVAKKFYNFCIKQ